MQVCNLLSLEMRAKRLYLRPSYTSLDWIGLDFALSLRDICTSFIQDFRIRSTVCSVVASNGDDILLVIVLFLY